MIDKAKRLSKILSKMRMKGKLKPVDSLDEARIVLVEDKFIVIDEYIEMVENGHTFPKENVYYLTF